MVTNNDELFIQSIFIFSDSKSELYYDENECKNILQRTKYYLLPPA